MKVEIEIPEKLLKQIQDLYLPKPLEDVIQDALKALVSESKRKKLIDLKGTIIFNIDLDVL